MTISLPRPYISEPKLEHPTVSVLVPVYNVEKYLTQCMESLINQSFKDFEVLCINDGSTDNSPAIIRHYMSKDPRFRIIDKKNSGYGASMNYALDAVLGTYIAILESDDFYTPDALEKLVCCAQKTKADVIKADFWLYWSTPEEHSELFHIVDTLQAGKTMAPLDDPAIFFRKPSIWSALYRRSFLREAHIRFLETPGASYQDAGFNFKVWASARKVSFLPDAIVNYRQDNETSSVNSPNKVFCVCDEYDDMEKYVDRLENNKAALSGILQRMKFDSYMWNFDRLSNEFRRDFILRAAQEFKDAIDSKKLDISLFEPWSEADLIALISDPEKFESTRLKHTSPGKFNTFKHYFDLGGFRLVFKVIQYKLFCRSIRRTNEVGGAEI